MAVGDHFEVDEVEVPRQELITRHNEAREVIYRQEGPMLESHSRPNVVWSDGNDPEGPPRGFYPVNGVGEDAEIDWDTRLRYVDDAPEDPETEKSHFEVMPREAGVGYFHGAHDPDAEEKKVQLEAKAKGKAKTRGGRPPRGGKRATMTVRSGRRKK